MICYVTDENVSVEKQNQIKFWLNDSQIKLIPKKSARAEIKTAGVVKSIIFDYSFGDKTLIKFLHDNLSCPIIAKVSDDNVGISLMKEGSAEEYFIGSEDEKVEQKSIKDAYRIGKLRSGIKNSCVIAERKLECLTK